MALLVNATRKNQTKSTFSHRNRVLTADFGQRISENESGNGKIALGPNLTRLRKAIATSMVLLPHSHQYGKAAIATSMGNHPHL